MRNVEEAARARPAAPSLPALPQWTPKRAAASLLLLAGVGAAVILVSEPAAVAAAASAFWARPELVAVFLLTYVSAFACRAAAWRVLLRSGLSTTRLLSILHAALLVNHVFPAKAGEPLRALLLTRAGVPVADAFASTVLARLIDFAIICSIAFAGAVLTTGPAHSETAGLAGVLLCLGLVACTGWCAAAGRLRPTIRRLPATARKAAEQVEAALKRIPPARIAAAILLTTPSWVLEAGALWAVAQGAGVPLAIHAAILVTAVTIASQAFQFTPGGLGLYEATMTGALALSGVSPEAGLPIALATHLWKFAYAFAAGIPAIAVEALTRPRPALAGREHPETRDSPLTHILPALAWLTALFLVLPWAAFRLRRTSRLDPPPPPDPTQPLVIIIPVHNEAAAVGSVVASIPRDALPAAHVVVVDDGSTDRSSDTARAAGADQIIRHPERRGLGAALRTGLACAAARHAPAVYIDGDGEYDPRDIPAVAAPVLRAEADYVLGIRFPNAGAVMCSARRQGNRAFTGLMRLLTGQPLADAQTGIRAFSARAAGQAHIIHDYNYAQVLTLDLVAKGLRLHQVPVTYRLRESGTSFVRYAEYAHRVSEAMVRQLLKS